MASLRSVLVMLLVCGLAPMFSTASDEIDVSDASVPDKVDISYASVRPPVLNRVTFQGNVKDNAQAENWVVFFCVTWYEVCQELRESYFDQAREFEGKLNADALLHLPVRFAEVDCTVDKVLCNEQSVETYPEIVHYSRGNPVARWSARGRSTKREGERMAKFLADKLAPLDAASEEGAPAEGGAAAAAGGGAEEREDIWSLHMAQQHPVQTIFRLAPPLAALVGMAVWALSTGAEILQTVRRLRSEQLAAHASPAAEKPKTRPPPPRPAAAAAPAEGRARRRLPEAWARARSSIEL